MDWTVGAEQPNTFAEMLSVVSGDRFCDEVFAETLNNVGCIVGKADYCGCNDIYYVEVAKMETCSIINNKIVINLYIEN